MINPWVLLGGAVLWLVSMFGSYQFGHSTATTYEQAQCAKQLKVIADENLKARDQGDAEKATLQTYANLLGKMYNDSLAAKSVAEGKLKLRTEQHVKENPSSIDTACSLPADLLRDINDAGGNSEGGEGESGIVVAPAVPVAPARTL